MNSARITPGADDFKEKMVELDGIAGVEDEAEASGDTFLLGMQMSCPSFGNKVSRLLHLHTDNFQG